MPSRLYSANGSWRVAFLLQTTNVRRNARCHTMASVIRRAAGRSADRIVEAIEWLSGRAGRPWLSAAVPPKAPDKTQTCAIRACNLHAAEDKGYWPYLVLISRDKCSQAGSAEPKRRDATPGLSFGHALSD